MRSHALLVLLFQLNLILPKNFIQMITFKNNINSLLELLINQVATLVSERLIFTVEEYLQDKLASTPKNQKLLLDTDELALQLSVSKSTIVKLRKQGMPLKRIGDSVRFDPKEVMLFINNLKNNRSDGKNTQVD